MSVSLIRPIHDPRALIESDPMSARMWAGQRYAFTTSGFPSWIDLPAPDAGDFVSMGDFRVPMQYGYSEHDFRATHVVVPYATYGDYTGDSVTRANHEALLEDYPETFVVATGDYSTAELLLPLDRPMPDGLLEALQGLSDYPLYSDDSHSTLEFETEREDWDSWGRDNFQRALDMDDPLTDSETDDVFSHVRSMMDNCGGYYMETAVSGLWGEWDAMVAAARSLLDSTPPFWGACGVFECTDCLPAYDINNAPIES